MVAEPATQEPDSQTKSDGLTRSDRLLTAIAPFPRVVVVSHINPDPDSLASMLGVKALIESSQEGKTVTLTVDGMIARAENRAMAELIPIPLVPVEAVGIDNQTGRHHGRQPASYGQTIQRRGRAACGHRPPRNRR